MKPLLRAVLTLTLSLVSLTTALMPTKALATADQQSFLGAGLGFEFLSRNGTGTGFYFQGFGGYAFDETFSAGLHAGYSNVGDVGIKLFDFGIFAQVVEQNSGGYLRFYADGVNATVKGGGSRNGIDGSQLGFAPGIGLGFFIPTGGDLHLVPELAYKVALLDSPVNLLVGTVNLVWDY